MNTYSIKEYNITSKTQFGLNIIEADSLHDALTQYMYNKYQQEIDSINITDIDTTLFDNQFMYKIQCVYKSLNNNYSNFIYNTYLVISD